MFNTFTCIFYILVLVLCYQCDLSAQVSTAHNDQIIEDQRCILSGRVIDRGTPIKGANIHIRQMKTPDELAVISEMQVFGFRTAKESQSSAVLSDEGGAFCFKNVKSGYYTLVASKPGYMDTSYGSLSAFENGKIISVKNNEPYPAIKLELLPQAVIAGKVVDSNGDPIDDGSIVVISKVVIRGMHRTLATRTVQVNDLGEFRVARLPPGRYYVQFQPPVADAQPSNLVRNTVIKEIAPRFVRTYFPNTTDISQASPIIVRAGEMSNVVIDVPKIKTFNIRGQISGTEGYTDDFMMYISSGDIEETNKVIGGGFLKPDNTFEFADVAPGSYVITYIGNYPRSTVYIKENITVGERDINNLNISPLQPVELKGKIKYGGNPKEIDLSKIKLALRPTNGLIGPSFTAEIDSIGNVRFGRTITSGTYTVTTSFPQGYYMKSLQYGGSELPDAIINTAEARGNLEIFIDKGTSQLQVRIEQDSNEHPGSLYCVIAPLKMDESKLRIAFTDDEGNLTVNDIAPDTYRIYAFKSADLASVRSVETLKLLESFSSLVEVKVGANVSVNGRVVPADQASRAFGGIS